MFDSISFWRWRFHLLSLNLGVVISSLALSDKSCIRSKVQKFARALPKKLPATSSMCPSSTYCRVHFPTIIHFLEVVSSFALTFRQHRHYREARSKSLSFSCQYSFLLSISPSFYSPYSLVSSYFYVIFSIRFGTSRLRVSINGIVH
uniref:Uncharacterized protein n=1 Tax=Daphnia magna TaxID=35525 RepID=A0A0P5S463_9CRUS